MDAYGQDTVRCVKCRAPIGNGGGRCPYCGTELPVDTGAKPFVPAIVGMNEHHEAALARSRSRPVLRPAAPPMSIGTIVLFGGGIVAATVVGSLLLRAALQPKVVPSVAPPAVVQTAQVPMINGVAIPDRHKVDATDLLPSAKRRVSEGNQDAALVEIVVVGAQGGAVDLEAAGAQISYRYVVAAQGNSAADPLSARERVDLVISDAALPLTKGASKEDKAVPDPICVWSAAWRAAMASGLSPSLVTDAKYAYNAKSAKPSWFFTVRAHPELEREIDGMSCAIRVRQTGFDAAGKKLR